MPVEWSTVAFGAYLGLTVVLVILLGIKAYVDKKKNNDDPSDDTCKQNENNKTNEDNDTDLENNELEKKQNKKEKSYLQTVWSMKSVYGTVLVHLYDTSTDIGVVVAWATLTYNEFHNDSISADVHMLSFLIPACVLLFLHRIVFMVYYYIFLHDTYYFSGGDMMYILTDTYILKIAYDSFQEGYTEPCVMQKNLQLWESVFESMPQLVLQTVFLIQTNQSLSYGADMILIFLSITASIISVVTKYIWYDSNWVKYRAQSLHFKCKEFPCCVSYSYLARFLWRFSELLLRFIIFALIWSVLGGIYLIFYLIINWIFYFLLEIYTKAMWITLKLGTIHRNQYNTQSQMQSNEEKENKVNNNNENEEYIDESLALIAIIVLQAIIGIPLRQHLLMNIIRFIDNASALALVAFISLSPEQNMECGLDTFCNNTPNKYAHNNGYIMVLLALGGIMLILEGIIYVLMYTANILKTKIEHKNYTLEDIKDDKLRLTEQEQLMRLWHPLFVKRARKRQNEQTQRKDLDVGDVLDNETGFGKDLDVGDVAFNPMASGVPLPVAGIRPPNFRATSVSSMFASNYYG